jgi:ribosomal protein S11
MRKIKPQKDAAADATYQLLLRDAELKQKEAELQNVKTQFKALEDKYKAQKGDKMALIYRIKQARIKIDRAQILLDGLTVES